MRCIGTRPAASPSIERSVCGLEASQYAVVHNAGQCKELRCRHCLHPASSIFAVAGCRGYWLCLSSCTGPQVVERAAAAVSHARSLGCRDIEFSPEDAGRSDPVFLYRILGEVIKVSQASQVTAQGSCEASPAQSWHGMARQHARPAPCASHASKGTRHTHNQSKRKLPSFCSLQQQPVTRCACCSTIDAISLLDLQHHSLCSWLRR